MDPHIALGMKLRGLLHTFHLCDLRQNDFEQSGCVEQLERASGMSFGQHLEQFVAHALATYLLDLACESLDGGKSFVLNLVTEAGSEAHGAQHAQLVFFEASYRVPDSANDAALQVHLPA